ncbi:hypothetical protein GFO_0907 [Christiangramia forsetii KT0803]|uniref:Uncharacterized protein n=1 Tax=Christiangramia forsetii (strain DSM 17595 / CGMCC 1.15422 / KT0803) TaxID=411154 RepID=A0LZT6_CHRFK|nr:hypothetical protein GFO_0907 [Christiangramia forsetii KT0803]
MCKIIASNGYGYRKLRELERGFVGLVFKYLVSKITNFSKLPVICDEPMLCTVMVLEFFYYICIFRL